MSDFPGLRRLLEVMRRLRDPAAGCPWDLAQDGRSLARYTLEEAHELAAALEAGLPDAIRDELGDLLFQVVFHAQLALERGDYDFDSIASGIAEKLTRRHPHVFGEGGGGEAQWEAIKAAERGARGAHGVLDDVPLALPALTRATKLGKRAAAVGFDWPDAVGARAKVLEELAEVDAAASESPARLAEEVGDLLLAVTSLARHLRVDPETALRQANQRFETRFRRMEAAAAQRGLRLEGLDAAQWDSLWEEVKRSIQS
jgi:nucleoside triphosphate diphosphatase